MNPHSRAPSAVFVDDEPAVLRALRRTLRTSHRDWQLHFFSDPREALEQLAQIEPWILVSDRRMPGLDGVELLQRAVELVPEAIRVLLTGDIGMESALRGTAVAHFILRKPYETESLADIFVRARILHQLPLAPSLRLALGALDVLPVRPAVYHRIATELQQAEPDLGAVARAISQDQVLLSRVLRVANSPFFGFSSSAQTAEAAVLRLGLEMIQHLVLLVELYQCGDPAYQALGDRLMHDALAVAERIRSLCDQRGISGSLRNRCLLAALLHNIGALVLFKLPPPHCDTSDAMSVVGAYLLELWGFEAQVVEAVLHQDDADFGTQPDMNCGSVACLLRAALQDDPISAE